MKWVPVVILALWALILVIDTRHAVATPTECRILFVAFDGMFVGFYARRVLCVPTPIEP